MNGSRPVARMRSMVSLGSAFALLFLLLSGIALYVAPQCRVAVIIRWSFLWLGKESWETMHVFFALIFVILSLVHLGLNWRVFAGYVVRGPGGITRLGGLFTVIGIIAVFLFVLSAFRLPPAVWVHEIHERIKHSWSEGVSPGFGQHGRGMHSPGSGRSGVR